MNAFNWPRVEGLFYTQLINHVIVDTNGVRAASYPMDNMTERKQSMTKCDSSDIF